jgi:16S rRNA (cytidine1402-2'-O)-methyltransferase
VDVDVLVPLVLDRVTKGERLKDAAADVAQAHGLGRREVYQAVLAAREAAREPRQQG